MKLYNYSENNELDIINLKKNLMKNKKGSTTSKESDIPSIVKQNINTYLEKIFEDNIRAILENKCKFIKFPFSPEIYYKKIQINENYVIKVIQGEETVQEIFKNKYKILFANDFSFLMVNIEKKDDKVSIEAKFSNCNKEIEIDGKTLTVLAHKQIGIDGFFEIKDFKINLFDPNEVDIVFSNINNENANDFKYAVIESKLSPTKIGDMVRHIQKDYNLLKRKYNNIVFLGFVNSNNVQSIKKSHLSKINCVIYGIKNSLLFGKNVSRSIDWDLEKKVNVLSMELNEIKGLIKDLKGALTTLISTVNGLKERVEKLEKRIGEMPSYAEEKKSKEKEMLCKKRERDYTEENEE